MRLVQKIENNFAYEPVTSFIYHLYSQSSKRWNVSLDEPEEESRTSDRMWKSADPLRHSHDSSCTCIFWFYSNVLLLSKHEIVSNSFHRNLLKIDNSRERSNNRKGAWRIIQKLNYTDRFIHFVIFPRRSVSRNILPLVTDFLASIISAV